MNETEFETAGEAAVRLGVTVRAIQKSAAEGRIQGATKHGKMWLIPKGATVSEKTKDEKDNGIPDVYQLTPFRVAMPLLNSAYPVGKCMEYIEAMPDKDDRAIALGEYYFFSGRSDEAARVVAQYQDSHDPSLRFSANLIATFANLAGGHTHLTRFAMGNLQEQVRAGLHSNAPAQLHAIGIFTATAATVPTAKMEKTVLTVKTEQMARTEPTARTALVSLTSRSTKRKFHLHDDRRQHHQRRSCAEG